MRVIAALLVWCGFLFFYGLNAGDLLRTEGLRALVAAECLRNGEWLVPTLYGQPLFTKPPGMYVAIALVSWPFGAVTDWSARLPSALAATATVFLFYWHFRQQLGQRAGLIVALILPLSFLWLDKASAAEIDMLQVAWVSAAILFFLRALEGEEDKVAVSRGAKRQAWWLLSLLCVASGVLTKWTAPAFYYLTVVPLLAWRGQLRLLFGWRHLFSLQVAMAVCLGWAWIAGERGGWQELATTVRREAVTHLSPGERQAARESLGDEHRGKPGYGVESVLHPFKLLALNLPWSGFALLTLWPRFYRGGDERGQRLIQALHCWAWPSLLFWSLVPQHSVRHSFPLCPAIAGLAALVWIRWLDVGVPWRVLRLRGATLAAFVVLWVGVKLCFVHGVLAERSAQREPRAKGTQLAALVPAGQTLYLCRFKDEGLLFYYGRPARRLETWADLPSHGEPVYGILCAEEVAAATRPTEVISWLRDQQSGSMALVRMR